MQATRRRGRVAATSSPLVSIAAQIVGKFRARLSYVSTFIATSVAQLRFEVKGGPPHANHGGGGGETPGRCGTSSDGRPRWRTPRILLLYQP